MNIDDIIEYDDENTNLDFKKIEYGKHNFEALIKDVMSMANAFGDNAKRIIIGVKDKPGEDKEFLGLENITDQATYENIIQENIEPTINFKYYSYNFKGKTLGIIELIDTYNKPYMMRKDYGEKLKRGDIWIRKGSRQSRMVREDIDKIFAERTKSCLYDKIDIGFGQKLEKQIAIKKNVNIKENLPSEQRKKEVIQLLERLEKYTHHEIEEKEETSNPFDKISSIMGRLCREYKEEDQSIRTGYNSFTNSPVYRNKNELENELKNIKKLYHEEDLNYYYEKKSDRFNCQIYNDGNEFLEDVEIMLYFDKNIFDIAERIYEEPPSVNDMIANIKPVYEDTYPIVYENGDYIIVQEFHENIRHKTRSNVLCEDLRFLIRQDACVDNTKIKYRISAKNLPDILTGEFDVIIS